MNIENIKKYLGMAVTFVYYHQESLYEEKIFPDDYYSHLKTIADKNYWLDMHKYLGYALTQEDYCLPLVNSPLKERFSEEDIKLFFRKFHEYLGKFLESY